MEKTTYQLRIDADEKHYDTISSLIGFKPKDYLQGWSYEVILEEELIIYDVIEKFLSSLQDKFEALANLGVQRKDITLWIIYAYNGQCNMEFIPETLKSIGENGITLCISCYDAGEE